MTNKKVSVINRFQLINSYDKQPISMSLTHTHTHRERERENIICLSLVLVTPGIYDKGKTPRDALTIRDALTTALYRVPTGFKKSNSLYFPYLI